MYGPMDRCLRNLYPANWRSRRWCHRTRSASVGLFLSFRALAIGVLKCPHPFLPPETGEGIDNAPTFQSIRIVGTALTLRFDSAYIILPRFGGGLRWGLATNVSCSFTLSTAPSASARCSPGSAPPLG